MAIARCPVCASGKLKVSGKDDKGANIAIAVRAVFHTAAHPLGFPGASLPFAPKTEI
jgi:hypothetical protein